MCQYEGPTPFRGRTATYIGNNANESTSRTVPGFASVVGTAATATTVTINGQPSTRQGEFFHREVAANNSAAPAYSAVTVQGVAGSQIAQRAGRIYFPRTPELFTHDADGNLLTDGRWSYVWDAENRLTQMTASPAAIAAGVPAQRLTFTYDFRGRRVSKQVDQQPPAGGIFTHWHTTHYLYDGWNLLAEIIADGGPLIRNYVWGTELSGTQQGAGGIGGLLFIGQHPENQFYSPIHDGTGNVLSLVNLASPASPAAVYEYGPFGESLTASGPYADINPFRFSSKYHDSESGFAYYGYRFYNPNTGRWLNRDPIGERGGVNLYAFVNNDPVNLFDPLGLQIQNNMQYLGVRPPQGGTYGATSTTFTYSRGVVRYDASSKKYWIDIEGFSLKGSWWHADKYPSKNATNYSSSPKEHEEKHIRIYLEQGNLAEKKIEGLLMCENVAKCFKSKVLGTMVRAHYHDARWHSLGWDVEDYSSAAKASSGVAQERSQARQLADKLFAEAEQLLKECQGN